ncbi:MAG: bifunctional folylpolyglutamate synthase/dihydrofolate synthase [Clostridia bacterium]|nr:bifunctional folylpolyglutamate synthase/dihydrofolate synthase [Clostridia bacterium]
MDYEQALAQLHSLSRKGVHPGLERIRELSRRLGRPEQRAGRLIHIAGTNGKGSVAAMLDAMLRQSGAKTGLFTSPHLHCHSERYRINGEPISRERFAALFTRVAAASAAMIEEGWEAPTEFETVTALALLWFAEEHVDQAVIEVGLGGRTDSTNIIDAPFAVITNVGMDHMDFLGATLPQIAAYKAGVIKRGARVVTAAQGEAFAVIEAEARRQQADLLLLGRDFTLGAARLDVHGGCLDIQTARRLYRSLQIPLAGRHQLVNAALAVQMAELLDLPETAIREGLAAARWPARLELIAGRPLILLDGAHNVAGMQALTAALDELWPGQKIVCLLGMLADKEREQALRLLLPRIRAAVVTPPPYLSRRGDWQMLAELIRNCGKAAEAVEDNRQALRRALALAADADLLLVCGSLYLVGAVRDALREENYAIC